MQSSRLESLPVELLDIIFGYLLPSHKIRNVGLIKLVEHYDGEAYLQPETNYPRLAHLFFGRHGHPYLNLQKASLVLGSALDTFCHDLLKKWARITRYKLSITPEADLKRDHIRELVEWTTDRCVWCGKNTPNQAIMFNGFACCRACDAARYPNKITMTKARQKYRLTDENLFRIIDRPEHWPYIRFGMYSNMGNCATMYFREDVERLADAVHGDTKAEQRRRKEAADARKRKIVDNKRMHIERGDCPGKDCCRYCIDVRQRDGAGPVQKRQRKATADFQGYVEIPDDVEDREVWIQDLRRTAAEDPNWGI